MTGFFLGFIFERVLAYIIYKIKIFINMIKSKTVSILINRGNLPFYSKNRDIKIGEYLEIDVCELSKGSNISIIAICDICLSEIEIKYSLYNKRFKKNGSFACCKKCSSKRSKDKLISEYGVNNIAQVPYVKELIKKKNLEKYNNDSYFGSEYATNKNKEIFLEKWGVDNPLKVESIKEKLKKTNIKRFGTECTLRNKEIRNKIKKTNLKRFGNEVASKSEYVKNKIKKTNQEKFGGNSPMCNDLIKDKSKKTLLNNYQVENPLKSKEIMERLKKTNFDKLGVNHPTQSEIVINKRRENNIEKWGTPHVYQSNLFRGDNLIISSNEFYISYLGDEISLFKCDYGKDHLFEIKSDNFYSRTRYDKKLCTLCNPINDIRSIGEKDLLNYINSIYSGEILESYRDYYEIDIYLPELKLGFEFNGLYWHSEKYKDKNYHLNKSKHFDKNGIRIIHIWEDDWIYKQDILKSQISNMLGNSNKIFARKTNVRVLKDIKLVRKFLDNNHIQGFINSKIKLGLFFEDELVSIMTFDNFEGRKKMEEGGWNLSRFCNKLNISIVGGASKLLKYFINEYNPKRIVSYADRDWSIGNLYSKLGFDLINETNSDYKYVVNDKRIHKSNFKKSKLKYSCTEREYTQSLIKIWDCGKLKYEFKI